MNRRMITALVGAMAVAVALGRLLSTDCRKPAAADEQPYVALISKGFRHQFWQAVKAGAEQAGKEFNVRVTFEGAQEEGNVEQQIQLLQTDPRQEARTPSASPRSTARPRARSCSRPRTTTSR